MKHLSLLSWPWLLMACQDQPPPPTPPALIEALHLSPAPPPAAEPAVLADAPLTLLHPQRLIPSTAQQAVTFSPLAQLHYVGYLSTANQAWALIHSPYGTHAVQVGARLGLLGWQLDHIEPTVLTLSRPDAEPQQLRLSPTPAQGQP